MTNPPPPPPTPPAAPPTPADAVGVRFILAADWLARERAKGARSA